MGRPEQAAGPIAGLFEMASRAVGLAAFLTVGLGIRYAVNVDRRPRIEGAMQTVRDGAQDASASARGKVADYRATARKSGLDG